MSLASAIGEPSRASNNDYLGLRSLVAKLLRTDYPVLVTAGRPAPKGPCHDISAEKLAVEKALVRASGTWDGFQATRPFNYRPRD